MKQTSRALLLLLLQLMRKQMDSLLVNGETGDRAVGAAGGCSQYLPVGRKITY